MVRWLARAGLVLAALLGADALARFGTPVTLVKLQGDDHALSKATTRLEALEAVGSFLHQYLN